MFEKSLMPQEDTDEGKVFDFEIVLSLSLNSWTGNLTIIDRRVVTVFDLLQKGGGFLVAVMAIFRISSIMLNGNNVEL